MNTASTRLHAGLPATNIGAIVVTSSSEMMRGLVSATRSRSSDLGWATTTGALMRLPACHPEEAQRPKDPFAPRRSPPGIGGFLRCAQDDRFCARGTQT